MIARNPWDLGSSAWLRARTVALGPSRLSSVWSSASGQVMLDRQEGGCGYPFKTRGLGWDTGRVLPITIVRRGQTAEWVLGEDVEWVSRAGVGEGGTWLGRVRPCIC